LNHGSSVSGCVTRDANVWDAVRARLSSSALGSTGRRPPVYLLSGILRAVERKIARANRLLLELPDDGLEPMKAELARLVHQRNNLRRVRRRPRVSADELRAQVERAVEGFSAELVGSEIPRARAVIKRLVARAEMDAAGEIVICGDMADVLGFGFSHEAEASRGITKTFRQSIIHRQSA